MLRRQLGRHCAVLALLAVFVALEPRTSRAQSSAEFNFLPEAPVSEYLPVAENGPDHGFCSKWDPEYGYRGKACCERVPVFTRRSAAKCSPLRIKWAFCDEMTPDQRRYIELTKSGEIGAWWEKRTNFQQSRHFCSVNQGFLVHGRPLVPTSENRMLIRNPNRCTNFGTDGLVGALEWVGREIHREYSDPDYAGVRLNIGDLSAPRGGCISGRRGRRGHASHTNGQDADVGFLNLRVGAQELNAFSAHFDPQANLWFLKKVFANPFACVKAVFVDQRHIRKLAKVGARDEEWQRIRPYVKHIRGHKSHFHIRVGDAPGAPGCPNLRSDPDWEFDPTDEEEYEGSARVQPVLEAGHDEQEASDQESVGNWKTSKQLQEKISVSSSAPIRAARGVK
ncbi:hypothetical protein EBZ37_05910 [bacterium]|nr:hypothetical protein [bacterium]